LSRDYFDKRQARAWASRQGFRSGPVDTTDQYYRIRQRAPGRYKRRSFRTIELTKGVKAVIGRPRKGVTLSGTEPKITITTQAPKEQTGSTVRKMAELARRAGQRYPIRHLATQITATVPSNDRKGELLAIYQWVRDFIRYRYDPTGIEWLQTPERTIRERAGDCDCLATLIASLASALGHPVRFRSVGPAPDQQRHIAVEAFTGQEWISLDPVLEPPGNPHVGEIGRFGARARGRTQILWDGITGRKQGGDIMLANPVPIQLLELMPELEAFPQPSDPSPPIPVPVHEVYRSARWAKVRDMYLAGDIEPHFGDFLDIVKSAVSFVPAVGPVIATGITVGQEVAEAVKKGQKKGKAKAPAAAAPAAAYPAGAPSVSAAFPTGGGGAAVDLQPLQSAVERLITATSQIGNRVLEQAAIRDERAAAAEARAAAAESEVKGAAAKKAAAAALKKAKAATKKAALKAAKKEAKKAVQAAKKAIKAWNKKAPYKGKAVQVWDKKTGKWKVYALAGLRPSFSLNLLGAIPKAPYTDQVSKAKLAHKAIITFKNNHAGKPPAISLPATKNFQISDDLLKPDGLYGTNTRAAMAWYMKVSESSLPAYAPALKTALTWKPPTERAAAPVAKAAPVAIAPVTTRAAPVAKAAPVAIAPVTTRAAPVAITTTRTGGAIQQAAKEGQLPVAKTKKAKKKKAPTKAQVKAAAKKAKKAVKKAKKAKKALKAAGMTLAIPQVLAIEEHVPKELLTQQVKATKSAKAAAKKAKKALKAAKKAIAAWKKKARAARTNHRIEIGTSPTPIPGVTKIGPSSRGNPALWLLVGLALARQR
jgi:hypothetical protein